MVYRNEVPGLEPRGTRGTRRFYNLFNIFCKGGKQLPAASTQLAFRGWVTTVAPYRSTLRADSALILQQSG